jgi:hypothetical protein
MSKTSNNSRSFAMNTQLKIIVVISWAAIVSSTSGYALDRARDTQPPARARVSVPYNARAEGRDIPGGESSLTPLMRAEPFTAAERRAFQTPTGRETDGW